MAKTRHVFSTFHMTDICRSAARSARFLQQLACPLPLVVVLSTLSPSPGFAQSEPNCNAPQTQLDMNVCAQRAWKAADGDLALAYGLALAFMKQRDDDLQSNLSGGVNALRAAQRAWLSFRDANCKWHGFAVRGGSMEPMVVANCLEKMTRDRTEELRDMTEEN